MGFFSRLGAKISGGLHSGARMGMKALGEVSRVGNTIAHNAEKVVNVVDRIPLVGQVLSPLSGIVRSGIGLVKDVSDVAGAGSKLLSEGDSLLSAGEKALKSGDSSGLMDSAKSSLERGKMIKKDTSQIMRDVKQLVGDAGKVDVRKAREDAKKSLQSFKIS
tara:strand:- start:90 stop:575 length:486 start_codon:yes stop_codon:yes gene_type:complete